MSVTNRKTAALALTLGLSLAAALAPSLTVADDIDIFTGASGGTATAPDVMILFDNGTDWTADQPNAKSKFLALKNTMDSIKNPVNVGLAMWNNEGATSGAYIRFGARDMSVLANRTKFKALIDSISDDANVTRETPQPNTLKIKSESRGFYEIFRYFKGLTPDFGAINATNIPNADAPLNAGDISTPPASPLNNRTAFQQGFTDGHAYSANNALSTTVYTPKAATSCSKNYIIYIAANNTAETNGSGAQTYGSAANGGPYTAGAALPCAGCNAKEWQVEWAQYLYSTAKPGIVTYVLDAFYPANNQDAGYSTTLRNVAKYGGGSYWGLADSDGSKMQTELLRIFAEIQAVNTTFASASLPVNSANRTQDLNQIFTGVFRPDIDAKPRWFGNMKRYQLAISGTDIVLADVNGTQAVNTNTGFFTDCAKSFWTSDSSNYWTNVIMSPRAESACPAAVSGGTTFSDTPDGPFVEKGGAAEVLRKGNNPPTTDTTPTYAVNRTMYTSPAAGGALTTFNLANTSGLTQSIVDFTSGQDANDENGNANVTETRPSIHGDVIHSRGLPINYGGNIMIYYGANDGTYRAVDTSNGKEKWSFIAPEFWSKLGRLQTNSPIVKYPNMTDAVSLGATPKDYFFDGSTGVYQNLANTKVWIYPSMRRGGRMVYSLDVTNSSTPTYKWKAGCPTNLANGVAAVDTNCGIASPTNTANAALAAMGQTWSMPQLAFIKGYSTVDPVVIVGGGYDPCEDTDSSTPTCTSAKGAAVFIFKASDGTLLKTLTVTGMRSVAADIALVDMDFDSYPDYGYVADTAGYLYRINFVSDPTALTGLAASAWTINKIGHTSGGGRKFLFPPALFSNQKKVYVALGSGDREHPLEKNYPFSSSIQNRFYVLVDDPSVTNVDTDLDDATADMIDRSTDPSCAGTRVLPNSAKKGWFMNLPGRGEQTVTDAVIAGGLVTFSTNRPIPSTETESCSTILGEAKGYFLNLLTGSGAVNVAGSCGGNRSGTFAGGGLPPSPVLATVLVGGQPKTVIIGAIQKSGAASAPISPQIVTPPINPVRKPKYWYTPKDN